MPWMFAGGGRMAGAMLQGLVSRGAVASSLAVADPDPATRAALGRTLSMTRLHSSVETMVGAESGGLVLAVKPQQMDAVLAAVAGRHFPVVVSIAAGIPTARIEQALAPGTPVVRAMPNTPALVGKGITAIAPGRTAGREAMGLARDLMGAIGEVVELAEDQIDAVTAISGSGPAYFFLFMQALQEAGVALGLAPDVALRLVLGTAEGAVALARHQEGDFTAMIAAVTSKGGTTERALEALRRRDLPGAVREGAEAAAARARELAG